MLATCDGKMAKGDGRYNAFDTANSATGSETRSSDVPQTGSSVLDDCSYLNFGFDPTDSQMEGTVQQPVSQSGCKASPSIPYTMAANRASGNSRSQKRKSTYDGSNMLKGKKIQRRISEKTKTIQNIVEICAQLVKINEQLVEEVGRAIKLKEEKYRMLDEKENEKGENLTSVWRN